MRPFLTKLSLLFRRRAGRRLLKYEQGLSDSKFSLLEAIEEIRELAEKSRSTEKQVDRADIALRLAQDEIARLRAANELLQLRVDNEQS